MNVEFYSDIVSNVREVPRDVYNLSFSDLQKEITDSSSCRLVDWKFIPPHLLHFGGWWKAGVKSLKHHFINGQIFAFEELSTLTAQIEAVLN